MKTLLFLLVASVSSASALTIPCDNPKIVFAPYAWRQSGSGDSARAEATLPGAYLKAVFTGSSTLGIVIDATANGGNQAIAPAVEWSVDGGAFQTQPINRKGGIYTLSLAQGLAAGQPHRIEFYFRLASLDDHRWAGSDGHLRVAGLVLDDGGSLSDCPRRKKLAIEFGDSITEGVGVESLFTSWQSIDMNNALKTWAPLLASSLDCEYGQLGSSGLGMVNPLGVPPLPESWAYYDKDHSRLRGGLLLPEPDYVFNNLGTNDKGLDIAAAYQKWITDVRRACPHARIFCVVPLLMGLHRDEIAAAVAFSQKGGDTRVYLIDLPELEPGYSQGGPGETAYAYDGCHPSIYGHAVFASHLAVRVQKILDSSP
jgi:lysophospholipase L1-like esterase